MMCKVFFKLKMCHFVIIAELAGMMLQLRQVYKVLKNHGVDPASILELEDAFLPTEWIHNYLELNDRSIMKTNFPKMTPLGKLFWGKEDSGKDLQTKKAESWRFPSDSTMYGY